VKVPIEAARDWFTFGGRSWLVKLSLAPPYEDILVSNLRVLEALQQEIALVIRQLQAQQDPQAVLLTSIRGVGYYLSLLIFSEIVEVEQVPSARHLCPYAGLVPSAYASGNTLRHGSITRQGSGWLRWALTEAAIHAARRPRLLQQFYGRLGATTGPQVARIAAARKFLKITRWMLQTGQSLEEVTRGRSFRAGELVDVVAH
jgi:transposase